MSDTHKRAELRGREAVAHSRIRGGVWTARLFAMYAAVSSVIAVLGPGMPHWLAAGVLALWAGLMLYASQRIEKGSRADAVALFLLLVAGVVVGLFTVDNFSLISVLITAVTLFATGNAVRGTFELAAVHREQLRVPPPPVPSHAPRVPTV